MNIRIVVIESDTGRIARMSSAENPALRGVIEALEVGDVLPRYPRWWMDSS